MSRAVVAPRAGASPLNARLVALYLRSRLAGQAVSGLAAVAALTWYGLGQVGRADLTLLLLTVAPLGAAVTIGISARSPFGEAEKTAAVHLRLLRLGHLLTLIAWAGLTLAAAGGVEPTATPIGALLRNGAGYAGLALLGAALLGAGLSWLPAIAWGGGVYLADLVGHTTTRWWMWPVQTGDDRSAFAVALGLLAAGLAVAVVHGARDEPGETA